MHHVLFIPGDTDAADATELLARVGLADQADGAAAFVCPEPLLPQGHESGQLVIWAGGQSIPSTVQFDWVPAVAFEEYPADRYFVGTCKEHPPKPVDLLRNDPIAGETIRLADGHRWMIPTLTVSPQTLYARDGATWGMSLSPRLAELWHRLSVFRTQLSETDDGSFDECEACDLVVATLNVNYRVPRELVGVLGVLTSGSAGSLHEVLRHLLYRPADTAPVLN